MPSNGHAGFGRRDEETDQSKDRHRASSRPHYTWIYALPKGELAREGILLRSGRTRRRARGRTRAPGARIVGMTSIDARPAEVTGRAVPGHWEGDLERHEAPCNRAEVKDLCRCAVAAA